MLQAPKCDTSSCHLITLSKFVKLAPSTSWKKLHYISISIAMARFSAPAGKSFFRVGESCCLPTETANSCM